MFTLRCTKKLLARIGAKPDPHPPPSKTKLGDWYADVLNLGRERLILCVSERTLLPVIVPAAGAAMDLNAKLARGLQKTLDALKAPTAAVAAEVDELRDVTIAKTASRVVLGSMNEFQFMVRAVRQESSTASLLDLGLELSGILCGAIDYERPREAALAALRGRAVRREATLRVVPSPVPQKPRPLSNAEFEEMVEEATVDAYGDAEQAVGWHCAIDEHLAMPFETEVLGVKVRVEKVDLLDDDSIVAICRRGQHRQTVPILALPMPRPPPEGAQWIEAYRRWKR